MKYLLAVLIFIIMFGGVWCLCKDGAEADRQLRELWSKKDETIKD